MRECQFDETTLPRYLQPTQAHLLANKMELTVEQSQITKVGYEGELREDEMVHALSTPSAAGVRRKDPYARTFQTVSPVAAA